MILEEPCDVLSEDTASQCKGHGEEIHTSPTSLGLLRKKSPLED